MCSEQPRVQPNAADPLRHETGVLPSCHALPRVTSSGEQEFAGLLVSRTEVVIDCLPGLLGHLEPDRLPGLLLPDPIQQVVKDVRARNPDTLLGVSSREKVSEIL